MDKRAVDRRRYRTPVVGIKETPETVVLEAEMPGVAAEDFDIQVDGGTLTISGKRATHNSSLKMIHQETDDADFLRTFLLGEELDTSRIDAKAKDGILTLTLHKSKEAAPQKIKIKSS